MNHLSEQQEQRLRELLAGRAEHVQIPEPLPPVVVRSKGAIGRRRLTTLAMAAVIALLAFGSARLMASAPEANVSVSAASTVDQENEGETTATLLVFIEAGSYITILGGDSQADFLIGEIESTGASAKPVQLRRDITEQAFANFWSDYPDVEIDNPRTWPNPLQVELASASDLDASRSEFLAIEGVVRLEPYPACGDESSLFPPACETADNRLRDFAVATFIALAIMAGLVRAGRLSLRVLIAIALVMFSAGLVVGVVRPVGVELDRAAPAIEQIRSDFGSDLTCMEWYDLEVATRPALFGQPNPRFENIDPGLVKAALDDGTDIYLWPVWVAPAIMAALAMLALAWVLPTVRPWKIVVRVAIVVVVLGGVVSLPTDFETNGAIQCLAE